MAISRKPEADKLPISQRINQEDGKSLKDAKQLLPIGR